MLRRWWNSLDRYLFVEVAMPFLAAQIVMIVMFIGTEALTEAVKLIGRYGLPWYGVMELLVLRIPWAIAWTLPMSMGMAVMIAVGRLCRDAEYTAMVVGGVSFGRLMRPMLLFALVVTGVAIWVQEYAGPAGMRAYQVGKVRLETQSSAELAEGFMRLTKYEDEQRITLSFATLDTQNREINEANLFITEGDRMIAQVMAARAEYQADTRRWVLEDGFAQRFEEGKPPLTIPFERNTAKGLSEALGLERELVFDQDPDDIANSATLKPDYLGFSAIRQRIRDDVAAGKPIREINNVRGYLHRRYTLATSVFLFMMVGAPLAVRPQRGASVGGAFGLAILLILVYYISWQATSYLGEGAATPLGVALWCWSVNIIGFILGLFLLRRVPD